MDTVEELNGTYFYNGIANISAGELFFWILLDEVNDYIGGIENITTISLILLGQPLIKNQRETHGHNAWDVCCISYSQALAEY